MEIIKISSFACPSCIIMNKVINKLKEKYEKLIITELDYDFDDVEKYNVGKILPVNIILKDGVEISRIVGEKDIDEFIRILEKYNE